MMSGMEKNAATAAQERLSDAQVRERLYLCTDPAIADEVYELGVTLTSEAADRIKAIEAKGTAFAAYGTATVTLLVSSAATWGKLGNEFTPWIGAFAGLSALGCTFWAVQAVRLRRLKETSPEDWLKADALVDAATLKLFRVLTLSKVLDSRIVAQGEKAAAVKRGQEWLVGAVAFLVFLLIQVACVRFYSVAYPRFLNVHQGWRGQFPWNGISLLASWGGGLLCGRGLAWLLWRSRRTAA